METKLLEIRDRSTMIPALAIKLSPTGDTAGDYLLRRAGYDLGRPLIMLTRLTDGEAGPSRTPSARQTPGSAPSWSALSSPWRSPPRSAG
jgi:hypothetical protein